MSVSSMLFAIYVDIFLSLLFMDVAVFLHLTQEDEIPIFNPTNKAPISVVWNQANLKCVWMKIVRFVCWILNIFFSPFSSLGCGIGYGYLHRIPTRPFEEGKKISFPGNSPSEPVSPLKDGFTEVRTHTHRHTLYIFQVELYDTTLLQSSAQIGDILKANKQLLNINVIAKKSPFVSVLV